MLFLRYCCHLFEGGRSTCLKCAFFIFQSDSGGAFKGFKGLVVPSGGGGGGGFSGFGSSAGGKPLEGLTNGNSTAGATPFSSSKAAAVEPKAAFGK